MIPVVGVLGEWPVDSINEFIEELKVYGEYKFIIAQNTIRSGLVPDGFERLRELRYAHEVCIAGKSDIVVFGNNGIMGDLKKLHLMKLYEKAPIVLWTPPDVKDDIPSHEEMISGIVQVPGNVDMLASLCAYICLR